MSSRSTAFLFKSSRAFFSFLALISSTHIVSSNPSTLNTSASNARPERSCVRRTDWTGTGYVANHCQDAVIRLVGDEVNVYGPQEFEFLAPNTAPIHALPIMPTPRRYAVGSCALVIAMLSAPFFPPGSIPMLPAEPFSPTDTANYQYIAAVAQSLIEACIDDYSPQCGGWQSVGGRNSIGVFLWATLSVMDRRVPRGVNAGVDGTVANGTIELGNAINFTGLGTA
ncbi:hypothetical protein MMC28_005963 [Mycoblastus sanguinarius]|nr:hypothetical protein [Mycoblastus sanguinarius]